ncbi:MAG: hypothetical protein JJD93_12755 [Ilumatobacteraceae bacterium]|nr:hypothetical protein [Ilumatobacteraceae bacterium]
MDSNDDGISFEPPRPEAPPLSGPPLGSSPAPVMNTPLSPRQPAGPPQFDPYAFVAQDGEPTATVVPAGTHGKRSTGKMVGGLIAVVALVGAGGFAVSKIVAGNDGGAASPTEVGTRLMDALSAEDALGVVDLLLPGERDMMRQPLIDIVDNLKRLQIVDSTASLDKVGGLDIAFDGVQVEPSATNVDDVSDIRITATGTASVNGDSVPIGNLLIDEAFGGDRPNLESAPQDSDIDWKLAAVKEGGRWYLSAFYSIAENARNGGDDIPAAALVARGADTPEGAVQAIFDAVDDLDLEALIADLNPNEAGALQRYAPMFIDDAQKSIDDLDAKIAFSNIKFSVSGDGDRRVVAVDGFSMTADAGDQVVTVESKGNCVVMTTNDITTDTCAGGSSIDTALGTLGLDDNEDVKALVKTVQDAFSDVGPTGITVQNVDGKWFVSPVGTVADVLLAELAALDKGELTDIIDGTKKVFESIAETIFSSDGGILTGNDGGISAGDISGFDTCFGATDYEVMSSCLKAGIDDGHIDPTSVPPYFRFAECGVGESYWNGDVYSMSDADFIAFATNAAPCFQQKVADGTITSFELPLELSRPDCLEGLNWYNVTDQDYMDRVFSCAG